MRFQHACSESGFPFPSPKQIASHVTFTVTFTCFKKLSVNTSSRSFPILKHFWQGCYNLSRLPPVFIQFYLLPPSLNASFFLFSPIGFTRDAEARREFWRVLDSCDVSGWGGDIARGESRRLRWRQLHSWRGTGGVNSSSAFNLSMQVLRFVTFTPCGSPLPLSASDRCGVELSNMYCVCRKCAFILRERVVVCFNCATLCARVCVLLVLWMKRSHSGLVQETRFDTSIVKITCVQTVIALQTIRTAITHF